MKVLEKEPVKVREVRDILKGRDKQKMTYEQRMALEAVKKQVKLSKEEEKDLIDDLENLEIRRLKKKTIYKLVEILPRTMTEMRAVTSDTNLREKELKKILEIIKKYVG